jgi:hypothetical protein
VESLDDVIDAMIADRVIHRHRRKWLIAISIVVVLALVVLVTGGWKEKKGRKVETLTAPVTVTAGRFEYNFIRAEIIRKPKTSTSKAEASVKVYFEVKNVDEEEHKSKSVDGDLLRLVPGGGQDLIKSNGDDCRGVLGWVLVYGLPPESCFTKFDVPPDFSAEVVEIGILGERYESDTTIFGANDDPYWHNETATAVVRVPAVTKIDTGEDK